ncbi:conserved Plasmodium protein, unknown function [Plasmodium reichenowi]|uniref:Uncharacterized protein n=11 Tax=Plasmodium (Laverania) TaxID=418107 RepID=C6S3D6_PLAF7|nr:conserved Plasmodium protein, unknown function [Plasmodium falciparum 3D7]XP_012763302.1 hypothetical protein PRSY57_1025900 [Plasmodium reichenowi]XP_018641654.1 hypothetical protein PGSY75_1026500 [Plasmodium gaboni]XP_028538610.1 conserved Plasmodium protein, unknown function [Plasmodium sp. gorilla clade G2]ETW18067.1 hypothetical protein PFFVO_02960 [Plasmodium falciparum Vietnam Oak-Knoll (FVO)]ETW36227.1 hypothetical protein PFTANZ_03034 [Plasmodium falciparum Tanzania (2000708)]ETW|eukprot:XP_002585413.1 conserved Plasmodium protein, unknown function [Plasmodium falciparum 3D7]
MYYKQYYTYDTYYRPYYPQYVLYEVPREKNVFCSLTEALCSCAVLIVTTFTSLCITSTDLIIRGCDNKRN